MNRTFFKLKIAVYFRPTKVQHIGFSLTLSLAHNTNQIIDDLLQRVSNSKPFTEFETARYLRESNNQPSPERKFTIKALVFAINHDRDSVVENVTKALMYIQQHATLNHCMYALHLVGKHEVMQDIFEKHECFFDDPSYVRILASSIAALPNLYYIDKILLTIEKTKKLEESKGAVAMSSYFFANAKIAEEEFGINREVVGQISKFASKVAGVHGNVVINETRFEKSIMGDVMNLTYMVEWNGTHLFDLNLALADLMIEHDLDSLPLIASFDLVTANMKLIKDMYVSQT